MHDDDPLALLDDVREDAQRRRHARVVFGEHAGERVGVHGVVAGLPVHLGRIYRSLDLMTCRVRLEPAG